MCKDKTRGFVFLIYYFIPVLFGNDCEGAAIIPFYVNLPDTIHMGDCAHCSAWDGLRVSHFVNADSSSFQFVIIHCLLFRQRYDAFLNKQVILKKNFLGFFLDKDFV
jgi:hypothetical protein